MSNAILQQAVRDELMADPKIDATQVAVSADEGTVTLRGTVGSPRQKFEAERDAMRVRGAFYVNNELQVRPLIGEKQQDDAELRGRVLQALMLNSMIPSTIDAKVDNGVVTLKGKANWKFERDEAEFVAANVPGVRSVRSEIVLQPAPSTADVEATIAEAYRRLADVDANKIVVRSTNGKVILSGTVSSWAAHDAAVDAAWWAPGVTEVVDRIEVRY